MTKEQRVCPVCGDFRFGSHQLPDGTLQRICHGYVNELSCTHTWHQSEDEKNGVSTEHDGSTHVAVVGGGPVTRPLRENRIAADGRMRQELVTAVRKGEEVVGANVWARGKDEAVFVEGSDLKRVAKELLSLDDERRTW